MIAVSGAGPVPDSPPPSRSADPIAALDDLRREVDDQLLRHYLRLVYGRPEAGDLDALTIAVTTRLLLEEQGLIERLGS